MSPRTVAFDAAGVIDTAIDSFTRCGYEGADTVRLCAEAGISRSSFYNTFKSKDSLFLSALTEYTRRGGELALALPSQEGAGLAKLRHRLLDDVQAQSADDSRQGCLSVNTAVELGSSVESVAQILHADRERWVASHAALLVQAQEEGQLLPAPDFPARAALLLTFLAGLRVSARLLDAGALGTQVDALLGSWATPSGRELLSQLAAADASTPREGATS